MGEEIHYPDGSVGVSANPLIAVINPDEEPEKKMRRPSSKHTFLTTIDKEAVQIKCGLLKLQAEPFIKRPEMITKDPNGKATKKVSYIKATGDLLPSGTTGKKWVNEEGKDVPSSEVEYYSEEDTDERLVQFEKTDDVEITKFLPRGAEDGFLFSDKQYEMIPNDDKQLWAMWKLARYLEDSNQIASGVLIQKKGWDKYGFLVIPYVDENKFSLVVKFTQSRIELSEEFEIPSEPASSAPAGGKHLEAEKELF